jgi:hypothetical protein
MARRTCPTRQNCGAIKRLAVRRLASLECLHDLRTATCGRQVVAGMGNSRLARFRRGVRSHGYV